MGRDGDPVTTVIGLNKPLYRFMRGEPKCVGVVMLMLGGSLFILGIPMKMDVLYNSADKYASFWFGMLLVTCGILYITSEKRPSKKVVTASLALSIFTTIGAVLAALIMLISYLRLMFEDYEYDSVFDNMTKIEQLWDQYHKHQVCIMELLWIIHSLVAIVILIVMTTFARTALRSNKTQATVITYSRPSH